jgi:NAD(P)-dependent dehydrogenase (short-subunit alcohol dehydrogenase family)
MDLGFTGKVVVVTGASKDIGYACAEAFVREGAPVALVSRSAANLDAALARIAAEGTLTWRVQEGLSVEAKMTGLAEEVLLQQMQAKIPLGRLGTPEEVAQVALFLASTHASHVTGAIVSMDGGANPVI